MPAPAPALLHQRYTHPNCNTLHRSCRRNTFLGHGKQTPALEQYESRHSCRPTKFVPFGSWLVSLYAANLVHVNAK